eukprot:CAMPEP_0185728190 /NCGR_PEP_ID=MMETSP1171-20130828/3629_1 /TAXON_ID=374046 /ORGANISM="Helicotheca tamensis, Strain CCMP826" /LENGTH=35 /DNA_ID= /DNA_START= /DNA_END= /DNA_ORIENTATION=
MTEYGMVLDQRESETIYKVYTDNDSVLSDPIIEEK